MKYEDLPESVLSAFALMMHDKGHSSMCLNTISEHLEKFSEPITVPLYRGITIAEESSPSSGWRSFSENKDVAIAFSRAYSTHLVLTITSGRGFNYRKFMIWLMDNDSSFDEEKDCYLQMLDKELEWFVLVD